MMTSPDLDISALAPHIRGEGRVRFEVGGRTLDFDLRHSHERAYVAKLLLRIRHPQSDVDEMLFRRFIKPGDAVLDAGANIGFTAVEMLAAGAASVVAVEPLPELFNRLKSIEGAGVHVINKAISSRAGSAELIVSVLHSQGSSLKSEHVDLFPKVYGTQPHTVRVDLTTIDELVHLYGPFAVWKLDIEGAEADALRGAVKALAENPPRAIIAELYDGYFEEFDSIMRRTHPFAYRGFIARDSYQLVLEDAAVRPTDAVFQTSPMYVYTLGSMS